MTGTIDDPAGIWRSTYSYSSSSREGDFTCSHYMKLRREGRHLVFESLPEANESYVVIRLSLEGDVASGSWQEATNPGGYYKGALYYGVIQMMVHNQGNSLNGKWLGFGKNEVINAGPWKLTFIGDKLPEDAMANPERITDA